MDAERRDAEGAAPSDADVLEALARILSSRVIARAERTSAFLEFVVVETLAGRSGRLKEPVIGRRALGVPPEYDPRLDPSVRVRAARVRRALQAYYSGEGQDDPLLIDIPRGTYVPKFQWRSPGPVCVPAGPASLRVEVPAAPGLAAESAAAVRERLIRSLRAYPSLEVQDDDAGTTARFLLRVTAGAPGDPTWSVALHDTALSAQIWNETARAGSPEVEALVARLPAFLGDYGGLITRRAIEESPGGAGLASQAALQFYRYAENHSIGQLVEAVASLEAAVAEVDDNALLLSYAAAAKAQLVLVGVGEPSALADAEAHIAKALGIAADHPAAVLAQALVHLADNRPGDAVGAVHSIRARQALDPPLAFAAGVILAAAGELEEGTALVRSFDRLHPTSAGYQHVFLTLERLEAGDPVGAMAHSILVPVVAEIRPLLHAVALDANHRRRQGRAVLERLPYGDLVRVEPWASLLARSWDIPAAWRDALLVRLTELLSPGPTQPDGPLDVDGTGSRDVI